jgi:uncharacterized protein (DUF433 family)
MGVTMACNYIERRESGFYIAGSRVPIDRIVQDYRNGEDSESIQSHYPTLSLSQVNAAIAFYLDQKDEVEQVMEERRRAEDDYIAAHPAPPDIKEKLERMRRQIVSRRN